MGDNYSNSPAAIKTMKLYSHVDRVYNELEELGYVDQDQPLKVEDVCKFDQYHYHGIQSVQQAIEDLNISESSRCLDIGSGLGGPGRYIASRTKANVLAIELQEDLHETAKLLTKRCGLDKDVNHLCGNILDANLEPNSFDIILSLLTFLHIEEKEELFQQCAYVLKPGGKMYIEDYFIKSSLTDEDKNYLSKDVFAAKLSTQTEYVNLLQNQGFRVEFKDVTEDWYRFVKQRHLDYEFQKDRNIRVHGSEVYSEQLYFFKVIHTLFEGSHLGGCKITATLDKH